MHIHTDGPNVTLLLNFLDRHVEAEMYRTRYLVENGEQDSTGVRE